MQVTVRTWKSKKDNSERGYNDVKILKRVEIPLSALVKIRRWAKEHQLALLSRKYIKPDSSFAAAQEQEWVVAMNQLFKELQRSGLNSEDERDAISFLFMSNRDNPELIDLVVAEEFLSERAS